MNKKLLSFVRVMLLLTLITVIVTLFAWGWQASQASGPSDLFDPTITVVYQTGSPAPLPTGTWVKYPWATETARAMLTPTPTPTDLVYPPVPATATPQIGEPVTAVAPQITVVVTGAVPITPPGPMPTPAPWCGTPPEWVHRWLCRDGKLIPITNTYLPMVRSGR